MKKIIKEHIQELDSPLPETSKGFFRKGKIQIIIIYPDLTYRVYFRKIKDSYTIKIKNMQYMLLPKCFIKSKKLTIMYYFNNPNPISFNYSHSKISSIDFYNSDEKTKLSQSMKGTLTDVFIDAKAIDSAFSSNLINKMYAQNQFLTAKNLLIMGVIGIVVVLVILQLTGTVDVIGNLNTMISGKK